MGAWLKRAATAAAVAMILGACGGGEAGQDYPAQVTENFLASCTQAGTSEPVCQCALDKMEGKYSIQQFTQEAIKLGQGEASEEFQQDIASFSRECQQEHG